MSVEPTIDRDVPCVRCGYNLRTLPVVHRCPECAFPALRSFVHHQTGAREYLGPQSPSFCRRARENLSALLGYDVEAIKFTNAALRIAFDQTRARSRSSRDPVHTDANAMCQSVLQLAETHFGGREPGYVALRRWRIGRSKDVGRIVAGLIEAGLVIPSEHDAPGDFAGVFDLGDAPGAE